MNVSRVFVFCFLLLTLSVFSLVCGAEAEGQDAVLERLEPRYLGESNVVQGQPELPIVLQEMVDQCSTALLDEVLQDCHGRLSQKAYQLELHVLLFPKNAARLEAVKLSELLDRTEQHLKIAAGACAEMLAWLDWYSGDDWQRRFGDTHFFTRLGQLQQNVTLVRCAASYYRAAADTHLSQDAERVIAALKQSLQGLQELSPGDLQLRLWQAKIAWRLAAYEPEYLDVANQQLQLLLREPLPIELTCDVRLALVRCGIATYGDKPLVFSRQVENVEQWLKKNQSRLNNYPVRLLELAVLELVGQSKLVTASLRPLKELMRDHRQLHRHVSYMVGGYLADAFNSGASPDGLCRDWDDFDFFAVADYYRSQQSPRYDCAAGVCEAFLRIRRPRNKHYPQMLYDLALCRHRLGSATGSLAAIACWARLAREFPRWQSDSDPQQVSASQAACLAAAGAYKLFANDADKYTDLALRTLPVLVEAFAESDTARQYRYYYGLVLKTADRHRQAADMFATVGSDDANKSAARYYAVLCRFRQYRQADENRTTLYDPLIDELNQLSQDETNCPFAHESLLLLAQLHEQLGRITPAIAAIRKALQADAENAKLLSLASNLLSKQRADLLELHAQGKHRQLLESLSVSLPLTRTLYKTKQQFDFARRMILEQLCLAGAVSAEFEPIDNPFDLQQLVKEAQELLDPLTKNGTYNRQLWFVRCRALLSFARGEYRSSQQLWRRIRSATADSEDQTNRYYWWQGRYFGLLCLMRQGRSQEASHAIDVLIRTHGQADSAWLNRLRNLQR